MRVHELAKELDLTTKQMIAMLGKLEIDVRSHSSTLMDAQVDKVRKHLDALAPAKPTVVTNPSDAVSSSSDERKGGVIEDEALIAELNPVKDKKDEAEADLRIVEIPDKDITVKDFAAIIGVPLTQIMTTLLKKGMMLNLNQNLEITLAEEIAVTYGIMLDIQSKQTSAHQQRMEDALLADFEEESRFLRDRSPVVTVMGHVDHGKTKLLDALRHTNVVDKEHGGITQHIGAYQVHLKGKDITFIDTPGHEAFTEIRARGANITDIVILVVAADDGIMPQTIEAIHHAKVAKVPIIVAVNKMDKPDANLDRVKQQLTEHDLLAEDWGGKTIIVPVSAKAGTGLEDLLEMVLLVAETEELKANPHKKAMGVVLEAHLSKNKGPLATVLIKSGTLRVGNPFAIGPIYGKIRAIVDDSGNPRKDATPSMPVEIMGLSGVPHAGDVLQVVGSEKEAKLIAEQRSHELSDLNRKKKRAMSLEDVSRKIHEGDLAVVNLIVKSDVSGSLEAILGSIAKIKVDKTAINIVHSGTGVITESDLMLAKASEAIVLGFNVALPVSIKNMAEDDGVVIRLYHIIYKLLEDLEDTLKGLLKPIFERQQIGVAEVRQVYKFSKVGAIAGSYVTEGKITRNAELEIYRGTNMVFEGKLSSLKRFKDDVKEVANGYECGIVIDGFEAYEAGDLIRVYQLKEVTLK